LIEHPYAFILCAVLSCPATYLTIYLHTHITREKLERANDPNVEYVDMEDFR